MKKKNIIKHNLEYTRIIKNSKPYKFNYFIIYLEKNTNDNYKFGISVSKKLGNAVVRNKLKRQIKDIIDSKYYENSFNCLIILRKEILKKTFQEKKSALYFALNKLSIIREDFSEKT